MFIRVNLLLTALVFTTFGFWGLLAPTKLANTLGLGFLSPVGETAIRAMYGGFLLGTGSLFAYCGMNRGVARFGLIAILLIVSAILTTRLIGFYLDRSFFSTSQVIYAVLEGLSIAVTAAQFTSTRRQRPEQSR